MVSAQVPLYFINRCFSIRCKGLAAIYREQFTEMTDCKFVANVLTSFLQDLFCDVEAEGA